MSPLFLFPPINIRMRLHEIAKFADIAPKNKWVEKIKKGDLKDIKKNLFVLIDDVYAPLGGHPRVKNPAAVLDPKTTLWQAADVDDDPEADAVIFGSKRFGTKIAGFGHDGQGGKGAVIKQLIKVLNRRGFWIEASLRPAQILSTAAVPFLKKQEDVEKIFGPVNWMGEDGTGRYTRPLPGGKNTSVETVFGKPLI